MDCQYNQYLLKIKVVNIFFFFFKKAKNIWRQLCLHLHPNVILKRNPGEKPESEGGNAPNGRH